MKTKSGPKSKSVKIFLFMEIYDIGRRIILTNREDQEASKRELVHCLKVWERELGDKPVFGGETSGLVDIALVPFYSWFYGYQKSGGLSIETQCPNLIAWAKRCSQKDSVSKSLADHKKSSRIHVGAQEEVRGRLEAKGSKVV
ncbi:probable glutathione S-transferase parC [Syzygium oleosum]|uniref:probable glutathione S-transferase parC n=1 Tax=Syzygium oleosum TaxID=219896 RepID=UPI0024BBD7CE|nr:probable glutathione S-transferase parC [Syzygium oleosum]